MKRAAVILCGSGFKDGSEIREAVGVLWSLSEEGVDAQIFALDEPQADVVNSLIGEVEKGEKRNQMAESARIARGKVAALPSLRAEDFDFLVMPGGFGAAKNLCDFATRGSQGKAHPEVKRCVEEFFAAGKPIGAVCIAPAVLALSLAGKGLELTVGASGEAAVEIEKLGHKHVEKSAKEWHVDKRHKVVTTPAYMFDDAPLKEIFAGIHGLVCELHRLA